MKLRFIILTRVSYTMMGCLNCILKLISVLCFLISSFHCFNTVGWVSARTSVSNPWWLLTDALGYRPVFSPTWSDLNNPPVKHKWNVVVVVVVVVVSSSSSSSSFFLLSFYSEMSSITSFHTMRCILSTFSTAHAANVVQLKRCRTETDDVERDSSIVLISVNPTLNSLWLLLGRLGLQLWSDCWKYTVDCNFTANGGRAPDSWFLGSPYDATVNASAVFAIDFKVL